jgi:hypothetical protein
LARKSNKDEKEVLGLIRAIIHYNKKPVISKDELMHLNGKIERFLQDD